MTALADTRAVQTVSISLDATCDFPSCAQFAFERYHQLNVPNYSRGMSILPCPASLEQWRAEHRTARKRADRAQRLGYRFDTIDRSLHNAEITEINTSLPERQGRPMTPGYLRPSRHGPLPEYPCGRHSIHTFGVLKGDILRAYLSLYRVGELSLVSMILGHGDHLRNDVMYLLFAGTLAEQIEQGGYWFYNRHDSGTDGLRYYKERLGFASTDIEWVLA